MKEYVETLTTTRNQMIEEYFRIKAVRETFQEPMAEAAWRHDEEEYYKLNEQDREMWYKMNKLQDAINMTGNAIGHLTGTTPDTFWGKK